LAASAASTDLPDSNGLDYPLFSDSMVNRPWICCWLPAIWKDYRDLTAFLPAWISYSKMAAT